MTDCIVAPALSQTAPRRASRGARNMRLNCIRRTNLVGVGRTHVDSFHVVLASSTTPPSPPLPAQRSAVQPPTRGAPMMQVRAFPVPLTLEMLNRPPYATLALHCWGWGAPVHVPAPAPLAPRQRSFNATEHVEGPLQAAPHVLTLSVIQIRCDFLVPDISSSLSHIKSEFLVQVFPVKT